MPIFGMAEAIHEAARYSFRPQDSEQEYLQILSVVLLYRVDYKPRTGSIGRMVARRWLAKARDLKAKMEAEYVL